MSQWIAVGLRSDLKPGEGMCVELSDNRRIAIFLVDDSIHAIDDYCPHAGAQLSGGWVDEGVVTCPWHAWRFRLSDGLWMDAPSSGTKVQTYPVEVRQGQIYVQLDQVRPTDT